MKGLNLNGFKKIKEDARTATMVHKDGHQITISKGNLPAIQMKQLEKLPLYRDDGGGVSTDDQSQDQAPQQDPNMGQAPVPVAQNQAPDDSSQDSDRMPASAGGASGSWDSPPPQQTQDQASNQMPASQMSKSVGSNISPDSIYGNEMAGIDNKAKAESDMYKDRLKADQEHTQNLAVEQAGWNERQSGMLSDIDSALNDVKNGHIDPKHYMENMSTPQKVSTAIGLFLGGWGSAYTHQGNPAMDFLNKQIDRDIEAQKSNQSNKINIYNGYLEKYKNATVAENMTRATELGIYTAKIQEAADKSGSPLAMAAAQSAKAEAQSKILPMVQHANFLQQIQAVDKNAQAGQKSAIDPSKLVPYTNASPAEQEKIFEEIKSAENVNNIRDPSLQAFDQAAKEVRPATGGLGTSLTAFVPSMESPSQKAFSGLANTTVKEIEGTARKAAMDSISHNYRPQFGDSQETINQKRQGWLTYLASQSAAPVASGHGINLQNYQSTATNMAPAQNLPIKGADGRMYVRQGNFMVPVK